MNYDPGPIPKALQRPKPLVGSHSLLNQYLNCPHATFHRYIAKTYPYIQSDAAKEGDAVHLAMENRLRIKQPLPPKYAQWEPFAAPFDAYAAARLLVEEKLGITADGKPCGFFDKSVFFRCKIDVALLGSANKAYIVDWKSGSSKYENPFELEIGAVLLQAKHQQLRTIKGQYVWLAENRLGELYNLGERMGHTFAKMKHLMEEIERDRARDWFEKRKSGLCGWCSCTHCENHFVARSG
jgi:hypothetical protein